MSDINPIFYLDKINELSADMPLTYHLLSETTRQLCLDLLTRRVSMRWAWRNGSEKLTDEEWDEAEAMVDKAEEELIQSMLVGVILPFSGEIVPDGFLECDGQEVSRVDYAGLFEVIGITYGSSSLTTFNVPDLRGRVPVGGDEAQNEFDELGKIGGEKTHALITSEMPAHDHPHTHTEITAVATIINGGLEAPAASSLPGIGTTGSGGTSAGGGEDHNNLQPYLTLNFIIKT
jgi:microcystin-dependent protein